MGWHSILQGIFLTQRSNPGLLQSRQILYHLSHPRSPLCIGGQPVNNVVTVSGEQWRDSAKGPSPNTVTFKYCRVRGRWLELQHMYFEGDRIHSWQKTSSCPCHIASDRFLLTSSLDFVFSILIIWNPLCLSGYPKDTHFQRKYIQSPPFPGILFLHLSHLPCPLPWNPAFVHRHASFITEDLYAWEYLD